MLSFDISVIDIVMMIAIIALLILYITKQSNKRLTEPETSVSEEKGAEKPSEAVEPKKSTEQKESQTRPQTDSLECPYHIGYLKKLPEETPIPDECFRCPRMVECSCG